MAVFFLFIRAEDGEHVHRHQSLKGALAALAKQLGRPLPENRPWNRSIVDDYGRVLRIENWPDGTSLSDVRKYGAAYEARECGTLTKAQENLLLRLEGGAA